MKIEELKLAKRLALTLFNEWNETSGVVEQCSGYYSELTSIIEDAVDIGAKIASRVKVNLNDYRD